MTEWEETYNEDYRSDYDLAKDIIEDAMMKIKELQAPHENILSDDDQYEDFGFTMLRVVERKLGEVLYYIEND